MPQPIQEHPAIIPNGGIHEEQSKLRIEDHEWAAALDVEPLPDGARRRQGLNSEVDDAVGATLLTSNTTGASPLAVGPNQAIKAVSQIITFGAPATVKEIQFLIQSTYTLSSTVEASIHADAAGVPGSVIAGCDRADFSSWDQAAMNDGIADWRDFSLATPVVLPAASYHLILWGAAVPAGSKNQLSVYRDNGGNPYAGGTMVTWDGSTWTAVTLDDLQFKLFSAGSEVTGVHDYQKGDGTQRHLLVTADGSVHKNSSGTAALVGSLNTAHGKDVLPSIAQIGERALITNNVTSDPSKKFYVTGAGDQFENEGLAPPTAAINVAVAAGGNLPAIQFWVDYYYWNDDLGIRSNSKYAFIQADAPSATCAAGNRSIAITNLPAAVARAGDRATHLRIEILPDPASAYGIGQFQWGENAGPTLWQVALGVTSFTITGGAVADSVTLTTVAEPDHDLPLVHSIKLAAGDRQFVGGVEGYPSRVYFSRAVGLSRDYESFPPNNFITVGGYVTSLAFVKPNVVVIGCKDSIWVVPADRPNAVAPVPIADGVGVAGHKSQLVVGRKLYFISAANRTKGPHVWDGADVRLINDLDDTFKSMNQSRLALASCAHLAPGDNRFQWWTLVSSTGQASHNRVIVFDYVLEAFSVYRLAANVLGEYEDSGVAKLMLGTEGGKEYSADSGDDDAGSPISGEFTLKTFDFGSPTMKKILRGLTYVAEGNPGDQISLTVETDLGEGPTAAGSLAQGVSSSGVLGTDRLGPTGTFILAASGDTIQKLNIRGSGRVFTPSFSGTGAWFLKSLSWLWQPTGRK